MWMVLWLYARSNHDHGGGGGEEVDDDGNSVPCIDHKVVLYPFVIQVPNQSIVRGIFHIYDNPQLRIYYNSHQCNIRDYVMVVMVLNWTQYDDYHIVSSFQ